MEGELKKFFRSNYNFHFPDISKMIIQRSHQSNSHSQKFIIKVHTYTKIFSVGIMDILSSHIKKLLMNQLMNQLMNIHLFLNYSLNIH